MSSILEIEPSSFEEAGAEQVCWDDMTEQYNALIKNDVRDYSKTNREVND
jgi:hypothetical protein